MALKVYPVTPIVTICVLIFSGLMVLYPVEIIVSTGEFRILYFMFFIHWLVVFLLALFCYALRIEVDEEEAEMRYVLLGITIRIPMDQILDFEESNSGGYVRVNTTIMPFFFRPSEGARKFLGEHCGTTGAAKGIGYGTGKPAESGSKKVVSAKVPAPAAMLSAAQGPAGAAKDIGDATNNGVGSGPNITGMSGVTAMVPAPPAMVDAAQGDDADNASFITITRVESEKGPRAHSSSSAGQALDMLSGSGEPTADAGVPKTNSLTPTSPTNRTSTSVTDRSRSPARSVSPNAAANRNLSPASAANRNLSPASAANRASSPGKGAGKRGMSPVGYKRPSQSVAATGGGSKRLAFRRQHSAEALQEWNEELIRAVVEELFKDHDKDLNGHISWKGDEAKQFLNDFFEVFDHPLPKGLSSVMSAQYAEVVTDSGRNPDTAEGLDIPQMCDYAHRVYKFTLKGLTGEMRAQRTKSVATGTFNEAAREARRSRVLSSINPELLAQDAANEMVVEIEEDQ